MTCNGICMDSGDYVQRKRYNFVPIASLYIIFVSLYCHHSARSFDTLWLKIHRLWGTAEKCHVCNLINPPGPLLERSLNDWNSTPRLVTCVDPYTLQAKSLPLPLKSGEVLGHKHWSDLNLSIHPA